MTISAASEISAIGDRLGHKKDTLKYSYVVLARPGLATAPAAGTWRAVSSRLMEKGRVWRHFCGPDGERKFILLRRFMNEANKIFLRLRRGDLVVMNDVESRERDERIIASSTVDCLDLHARNDTPSEPDSDAPEESPEADPS